MGKVSNLLLVFLVLAPGTSYSFERAGGMTPRPSIQQMDPHAHFPSRSEIETVTELAHAGFRERGDGMLERAVLDVMPAFPEGEPWNAVAEVFEEIVRASGGGIRGQHRRQPPGLGAMNQVLGVLWLSQFESHRPAVNRMIQAMGEDFVADPHDLTEPPVYWMLGPLLRIYFLFNAESPFYPGRLTEEAEESIRALLWNFCAGRSGLAEAGPERIWQVHDSENHDIMHKTTFYLASLIFATHPEYAVRTYYDGSSPAQQKEAWAGYFRAWLAMKGTHGLWIERNSATYTQFSLSGLLNLFDFAEDAEVQQLTRMLLDVSLVDWAQEQLAGVRGGAASRTPIPGTGRGHPMWGLGWVFFGNVGEFAYDPPQQMFGVTTGYRPPAAAVALAAFPSPVSFEIRNRAQGEGSSPHIDLVALAAERFGRVAEPRHSRRSIPIYRLEPDSRIICYTYRTPEYVLGMAMVDPDREYTLIHSQAKWAGAIMPAGGDPDTRIGPAPAGVGGSHLHFHAYWGVQDRSAMVFQLPEIASRIERMRVFFSPHLEVMEQGGWVFAQEGDVFAAVKVVDGEFFWEDEGKNYLALENSRSPVILQMGTRAEFSSFASFRGAVQGAPLFFEEGVLNYEGPGSRKITFFPHRDEGGRYRLPLLDGREILLDPTHTYQSPYLNAVRGSDQVEIRTGPIHEIYDFMDASVVPVP